MSALSVISYNKFIGFSDGNILNWCPTLNLLTISMNKMSLWVYRLNGERIYSVNNKAAITAISTVNDGSYFCLAGSDGLIKIYDSNDGKLVKVIEKTFNQVKLIQWNFHDAQKTQRGKFDDLFKVDILRRLPKLTSEALVTNSDDKDIQELNNIDTLNYLVIVDFDSLSINFNNLFTISDISIPGAGSEIISCLDNNDMFGQFYLIKDTDGLRLVRLTDSLKIKSNQKYLVEIILKACKLMAILNHAQDHLRKLQLEITSFFTIHDRYLANFRESIGPANQELSGKSIISKCLFDILLTNLIPEDLKDFWLNQFGERGFKRLNKLGNTCYDLVRNVIFSTLIASLERLLVIMNELRGLAQWFKDSDNELSPGLNVNAVNDVINQAKHLSKSLYQNIWDANEEQKAFNHYMTWLKREIIDKISKEDDMSAYLNQPQQVNYDHQQIINYINNSLFDSKLLNYFDLDLSSNEILKSPATCSSDLIANFNQLATKVDSDIIAASKDLLKRSLRFEELSYEVNLDNLSNLTFKSVDANSAIICGLSESKREVIFVKFDTSHSSDQCVVKTIKFEDTINSFAFKNNHEIVILLPGSQSPLVVFDFVEIFNFSNNVLNHDIIEAKNELTKSEIQLNSPGALAISRNESKSYGCLLDVNRRDYVVFSL